MKWLQISSGRGPAECSWVVAQLVELLRVEAQQHGLSVALIDAVEGPTKRTLKSALLSIDGHNVETFTSAWIGTIQWIGQSTFRPKHKRKNWFVDVAAFEPPEKSAFDQRQIKVETLKAGGPGGQHVNKTDSAVRITYLPTGLSVVAKEERSQFRNRKLALARLQQLITNGDEQQRAAAQQGRWDCHNTLERGNPIRVFKGNTFREHKL